MTTKSKIEWTEATWNPVVGCTWASSGCDHCYAATMTRRLEAMGQKDYAGLTTRKHFNGTVRTLEHRLTDPLHWRKPRVVFVNSMSDLFHPGVPFEFIDKVFAVMALTPQHTMQILSKRPERMAEYLASRTDDDEAISDVLYTMFHRGELASVKVRSEWQIRWGRGGLHCKWPLPNVWLGTSVEDQATADERIPHLLCCPASVRFLSCEPLLGPINLPRRDDDGEDMPIIERGEWGLPARTISTFDAPPGHDISWVIVGGESGPGARPCNLDWIRSIVRQCEAAGVACFVKQLGAKPYKGPGIRGSSVPPLLSYLKLKSGKGGDPSEWPEDLRVRQMPELAKATKP